MTPTTTTARAQRRQERLDRLALLQAEKERQAAEEAQTDRLVVEMLRDTGAGERLAGAQVKAVAAAFGVSQGRVDRAWRQCCQGATNR